MNDPVHVLVGDDVHMNLYICVKTNKQTSDYLHEIQSHKLMIH